MTMYKPMIAATLLAFAGLAQAQGYPPTADDNNAHFGWADVLRVDPIYVADAGAPPRQECYDQQVTREDNSHVGGTILGAIVGGALGNQVGKGNGRTAATIGGAVAGGAIGNGVSRAHDRAYTDTETHCRMVSDYPPHRRISAYDVEYRYRGEVYVSRLGFDPGERLRVRVSVTPAE